MEYSFSYSSNSSLNALCSRNHLFWKQRTIVRGTWCAQGDDLRTFLAEFVSILPQTKIPTQIEVLIYREL